MPTWRCPVCGFERDGRCKPRKCPNCDDNRDFEKKRE
ncbi:MAG: rubredoxin [Bacillota bacterium]|nr:rubredoxin [Bacillota bacterium]